MCVKYKKDRLDVKMLYVEAVRELCFCSCAIVNLLREPREREGEMQSTTVKKEWRFGLVWY